MNNKLTLIPMQKSKAKQAFYNNESNQQAFSRKQAKKHSKLAIKQARQAKHSFEY